MEEGLDIDNYVMIVDCVEVICYVVEIVYVDDVIVIVGKGYEIY